jgi:hypothetical protein
MQPRSSGRRRVGQAIRLPEFAFRAKRGRGELRSAAGRRIACPTNTEAMRLVIVEGGDATYFTWMRSE